MNRLSFLYVEDDRMSQDVMRFIIEDELGHELIIFGESSNFIARVEALNRSFDLIFLDIHLRPHSGFELLEMLRQHPVYREARIVAMTASVMNEEVAQLQNAGFDSCIAKPINFETFPQIVARLLAGERIWRIA